MKKFLSKVGTFLGGVLGFCFVAVVLVYSFKSTFFHNVNEDVERKQQEQKEEYHREYEEMDVFADYETHYYHYDNGCKGVHDDMTERMLLYKAEREGFEPCHFCAE